MVEISIICLVYKSKRLAEAVYKSLYEYTPKLRTGEAELLFVANDPTKELVKFLREKKYPHIININERLTDEELFQRGYGPYEYIRRVYQGYNQGILNANGQKIVLINSDNFFSKDWLENLLKYLDYKKVVTSTLVEPAQKDFNVFPGAIKKNFGRTLDEYKDDSFQKYADKIRKTGFFSGGAYMPCLMYRDVAVLAGLYPEGNIAGETFDITDIKRFGDEFFYDKLLEFGVEHITAKDSIVYHLKEGEKAEKNNMELFVDNQKQTSQSLGKKMAVSPIALTSYIEPDKQHTEILTELGHKFTIVIVDPISSQDLKQQVQQALEQCHIRSEIVVMLRKSEKKVITDSLKNIRYVFYEKDHKETALYTITRTMFGEYFLIFDKNNQYSPQWFDSIYDHNIKYLGNKETTNNRVIGSAGDFIIPRKLLFKYPLLDVGLFLTQNRIEIDLTTMEIRVVGPQEDSYQEILQQLELQKQESAQQLELQKQESTKQQKLQKQVLENSTSWRITKPLRLAKLTLDTFKKEGVMVTGKKVVNKITKKIQNKVTKKK